MLRRPRSAIPGAVRVLPLFVNRTRKAEPVSHTLRLALRGLLGEDAPVSSTVARLTKWNDELAQWRSRPLDDLVLRQEKEKAAVLVVMAALAGGEHCSRIQGVHRELVRGAQGHQARGLSCPRLVVGDGHLGIWGALRNVYPQAAEQRCWNHKIVNVLAKLRDNRTRPSSCCVLSPTRRLGRRLSVSGRCSPGGAATTPTRRPQRPAGLGPHGHLL